MVDRAIRTATLTVGPYALLAFAGLASTNPVVAVAASLGSNLVTPQLGTVWERCCRHFLAGPDLRTNPLQSALQQSIKESVSQVQERWWETPHGQREQRAVLRFHPEAPQRTEAAFDALRATLLTAASADHLRVLADSKLHLAFGTTEAATSASFLQYLLADAPTQMDAPLAQFVAAELPAALTSAFSDRVFDPTPAAEPVRFAFDRLTQSLQLTLLQENALTTAELTHGQRALAEELQRLHALDQRERDQRIVGPLQDVLNRQRAMADEVSRLADAFTRARAAKVRVVPVAELRWGIKGPRVDIRVPAWDSRREQMLPWEQRAVRLFAEHRVLVIKGKPSSGKTHLAGKLMRATPDALVVMPRAFNEGPPSFTDLAGHDVILFLDDIHERADTFDPLPWWGALEEACGEAATRLLVTVRAGDYWDRMEDKRKSFVDSLPLGSVFAVPDLGAAEGRKIGRSLELSDPEVRRFDGTIGSLVLDFSEMGEEYDRLAREEHDGVYSSRLPGQLHLV